MEPTKKKTAKSTFPKERLYQLQKNYRERKKEHVKKLESDLEEARKHIAQQDAVIDAALDEIAQLRLEVQKYRADLQAAHCELNLHRTSNPISQPDSTNFFTQH